MRARIPRLSRSTLTRREHGIQYTQRMIHMEEYMRVDANQLCEQHVADKAYRARLALHMCTHARAHALTDTACSAPTSAIVVLAVCSSMSGDETWTQ